MISTDDSFALKDKDECVRREAMLLEPHMLPLLNYLEEVKNTLGSNYEIPMFDPCDGGAQARVLILLEAPGPKAVGSRFISRNNPDRTASNLNKLLSDAKIPRKDTLQWNIVPWYIGDKKRIRPAIKDDIDLALPFLKRLIGLLTNLEFIVLMGKPAQSAIADIRKIFNKPIFCAAHPSPKVLNIYPEKMLETRHLFSQIFLNLRKLDNNDFKVELTHENIDELLVYLPVFNNPDFDAYFIQSEGYVRPVIKYHQSIETFHNLARQSCWYSEYDPFVTDRIFNNEKLLSNASLDEIKQLLTYFVCGERFSEGFQGELIKSGRVTKLLERLAQIRETI